MRLSDVIIHHTMKSIIFTILADLAIAALTAVLAELAQNTRVSLNPPELHTRLWALGIILNASGLHLELHTWEHQS